MPAACTFDGKCAAGQTCAGISLVSSGRVGGVCVPTDARAAGGEPCDADLECGSLLCSNSEGTGTCVQHCPKCALWTWSCFNGQGFTVSEEDSTRMGGFSFDTGTDKALVACRKQTAQTTSAKSLLNHPT